MNEVKIIEKIAVNDKIGAAKEIIKSTLADLLKEEKFKYIKYSFIDNTIFFEEPEQWRYDESLKMYAGSVEFWEKNISENRLEREYTRYKNEVENAKAKSDYYIDQAEAITYVRLTLASNNFDKKSLLYKANEKAIKYCDEKIKEYQSEKAKEEKLLTKEEFRAEQLKKAMKEYEDYKKTYDERTQELEKEREIYKQIKAYLYS